VRGYCVGGMEMRVKTESRREAILNVAEEEFSERGFEGASVSAIAARLGGSKQTLYGYFSSKDELFVEVMNRSISRMVAIGDSDLLDDADTAATLRGYGERYLDARQRPEFLSLVRLAYGESGRTDVGRVLIKCRDACWMTGIVEFLRRKMRKGELREADPVAAATQLIALLGAEFLEPVIFRAREPASEAETREFAARAVDAFLAIYAPRR